MKNQTLRFRLSVHLILRKKPSSKAPVAAQLEPGAKIALGKEAEGWIFASAGKKEQGWFRPETVPELYKTLWRISRDYPISLFKEEALEYLQQVVAVLWPTPESQGRAMECLDVLLRPALLLQDLARDAHGLLTGDPNGEERFTRLLDGLSYQPAGADAPCSPEMVTPISGNAFFLPFPRRPAFPCFFDSFAFNRPFEAAAHLVERAVEGTNLNREELWKGVAGNLRQLTDRVERLETLYGLARTMNLTDRNGVERFQRAFIFMTAQPTSGEGFPLPGEPPPFPFPFPGGRGLLPFDPCRLERWAGTERAARCFCREWYEVTRIVNRERHRADGAELLGEGCEGDLIEIEGRGFGDSRDWGFAGGQSEVIFSGARRTLGVPVAEEDYVSWSDSNIQVRVPAGAHSGLINIRILCRGVDVSECGVQLRNVRGESSARTFTFPPEPVIEAFTGGTARWCEDFSLVVRIRDAEVATIRDDRGEEIDFPEGAPGSRRTIEGRPVVRAMEDRTYTLTVSNGCNEVTSMALVERRREFQLLDSGNTRSGESVTLRLQHFCTPEQVGWENARFRLTFEDPDGVLIDPPEEMVVEGESSEATVTIGTEGCGQIHVTATPEDPAAYDIDSSRTSLVVFGEPRLTDVRPVGANACDPFRFELTGNCIALSTGLLTVALTDADSGRSVGRANVIEVIPGEGGSTSNVTVICEAPPGLGTHRINVELEQFGLASNVLSLADRPLRIPNPIIIDFTSSRSSIYGGGPVEDNVLRWNVSHASRIELWASGGRLGRGEGVLHDEDGPSDFCSSWSSRYDDRIQFPLTYELRAYPYRGGSPVTRTLEIVDTSEPPPEPTVRGFSEIRIRNCAPDRHDLHVWTRAIYPTSGLWEERGIVSAGYDEYGTCPGPTADSLTFSLDDGVLYEIQFVDPEQSTCGGRNDPTLSNCWRLNPPGRVLGDSSGPGADVVFGSGVSIF